LRPKPVFAGKEAGRKKSQEQEVQTMSAVNLSSSARTGLAALRSVAEQMEVTQKRLATGKAVNSPIDNASKFFTASKMDGRAAAIDSLFDGISNAQTTLKAASEGIKGIQNIIKQARSLTGQALATSDTTARAALSAQYTALAGEVSRIVADSEVNGVNLLTAAGKLTVVLDESGASKVELTGDDVPDLGTPASAWASEANVQTSVTALDDATTGLETLAASFGSGQALISVRKDFNTALSNLLKSGSNDLTAADMDQEAANLMALQTRQQMASTALSIMQSTESTALRLLR
jgi:flagellin